MRQTRDRDWLTALFDRHHRQVLAYAVRRVGRDHAEDVLAEVFAVAWKRRSNVPEPPLPWLLRAARNHVLHHQRALARRARLHDAATEIAPRSAPAAEDASRALVDSVLGSLDEIDAEILRLAVWEELTPAEISEVLGIAPSTARTRLMRARRRAQSAYAPDPPAADAADTLPAEKFGA